MVRYLSIDLKLSVESSVREVVIGIGDGVLEEAMPVGICRDTGVLVNSSV